MKRVPSGARRAFAALCAALLALVVLSTPARCDQPAIWQVQGGARPVWLFGTFPLMTPETRWQSPLAVAAFKDADVLVVEVHTGPDADAIARKVIKAKAFLKTGRRLRDYLSPDDQITYEMIGNRLGMFPAVLDSYRPWYASVLLSATLYREQGFRHDAGIGLMLQKQAKAMGKPVVHLDTAAGKMNFLADMSAGAQVDMLKATLHDARIIPDRKNDMLAAWKSGDIATMDNLLNESLRRFPGAYHHLLTQRNRTWLPRIEQMIRDEKGYFIAVGSAHLVGKDSVIAMLRARGYRVAGP